MLNISNYFLSMNSPKGLHVYRSLLFFVFRHSQIAYYCGALLMPLHQMSVDQKPLLPR